MKISIKILSKLHKIYTILTLAGVGISVSHVQKHLIRIVQERRRSDARRISVAVDTKIYRKITLKNDIQLNFRSCSYQLLTSNFLTFPIL